MRKIIHIDCDCFYASVEMRDRPELRNVPLGVGGRPEQRGVIATCNYPARKFGVHSAMPTVTAFKRCPDLVLVPPDFERYRAASRAVHAIFRDYTALIEPLSLDEAYLDVSDATRCHGSATLIAQEIRARIEAEVGITASAGIASNKLIAKIASDWHKPDGQFVVRPEEIDAFIAPLPVKKLWGVGKVTAARLNAAGAETCADLQQWPQERLVREYGKMGLSLYRQCRGIDHRAVEPNQVRKSLSVENTYPNDLVGLPECVAALPALWDDFSRRFARCDTLPHKAFVKIKFNDFTQTTMECVHSAPTPALFEQLLASAWQRKSRPVRLLGIGVRFDEGHAPVPAASLPLWDDADAMR
ncbi:DNA polymerase-4 [Andreprevotia lacus DSM 23236]|uniref:DNA polymerase IV n=1 Tax=Andreprevotia lacus DSM 23236 TaxID=1121001 RepID=A0A1W1XVD7_9NEIS|nr:DNA polymerase IV [Andreprevotia lacus]SMC27950.1 DNA polymerase-4 [Andreprevotia lacus DSM 23236]